MKILKESSKVIFLGALGSGLWALLSGILNKFNILYLTFFSLFIKGFKDFIYSDIGLNTPLNYLVYFQNISFWILIFLYFNLILKVIYENRKYETDHKEKWKKIEEIEERYNQLKINSFIEKEEETNKNPVDLIKLKEELLKSKVKSKVKSEYYMKIRKIFLIFLIVITIFITLFLLTLIIKYSYQSSVINKIEANIDILSPKISEKEVLILKAEYRQINSENDYVLFIEKIENIANQTKSKIYKNPEF